MGLSQEPHLTSLRRMFYLVTPNETSFKNVNEVPKYIEEASGYFFIFVLLELIISVLKQDQKYRLHDAVTSVSAGMFSRFPMMLFRAIHLTSYSWVYNHLLVYELPWNSPWTWLLCFLLVDMGYYWFHRLAHEVNFMWAAHQVHHSSEDYNFSTALRQSILQNYTSWVFYLPLALFIPPSVFMVHNELNILYQFWIHTQYIKSLGPLEYILNTPSHHRVHHGRNPYCIDKNYGGTLIIWDRLFGTFVAEGEEVAYGLTHPLGSFETVYVQFGYLQYMWGRLKELPGLGNKIRFILSGPGWCPGTPRLGNPEDIPQVEKPVKRYDTKVPMWINIYVAVHFGIVNLSFLQFLVHKEGLSQTVVIGYLALVLFSLSCFGRIFDKQALGPYLELLRCLVCLGADLMMASAGLQDNTDSRLLLSLRVIFGLSAALWGLQVASGAGAPAAVMKVQ